MKFGEIWSESISDEKFLFIIEKDENVDEYFKNTGRIFYKYIPLKPWKNDYIFDFWNIQIVHGGKKYCADCSKTFSGTENIFKQFIFTPTLKVKTKVKETIENFLITQNNHLKGQELNIETLSDIEYDVAISFAGENRDVASYIANNLASKKIKVFYDDFEKSNLWGKELVIHLDQVYRKKAKFCLILISKEYKEKIWTKLEFKSALTRSIMQNEEYILPLKIDNIELDGLRPTIGYISIKKNSKKELDNVINLILEKFERFIPEKNTQSSPKYIENIIKINKIWELDCLAFGIDKRYILDNNIQYRLCFSFGQNQTNIWSGFLSPSPQNGEFVFGIHIIKITPNLEIGLVDRWLDSAFCDDSVEISNSIATGHKILNKIDDINYYKLVHFFGLNSQKIGISNKFMLEEFNVKKI